jgi:hypothetical protein
MRQSHCHVMHYFGHLYHILLSNWKEMEYVYYYKIIKPWGGWKLFPLSCDCLCVELVADLFGAISRALRVLVGPISALQSMIALCLANTIAMTGPLHNNHD